MDVTNIQIHTLGNYRFGDVHATIEMDGTTTYNVRAAYTRHYEVKMIHEQEPPEELKPVYRKIEAELNRRIRGLHSARLLFGGK